jgi:hypothetical protein
MALIITGSLNITSAVLGNEIVGIPASNEVLFVGAVNGDNIVNTESGTEEHIGFIIFNTPIRAAVFAITRSDGTVTKAEAPGITDISQLYVEVVGDVPVTVSLGDPTTDLDGDDFENIGYDTGTYVNIVRNGGQTLPSEWTATTITLAGSNVLVSGMLKLVITILPSSYLYPDLSWEYVIHA